MFVVIFEVQPYPELWNAYLDTARLLRPELEQIDGFIDNDRYRSDRDPQRVLSLSTWRDEKAVVRWRTQATHHRLGQQRGRMQIFAEYRLRVGEVVADSHVPGGADLRQQRFDVTEVGRASAVTLTESSRAEGMPTGALEAEHYTSLAGADKHMQVVAWSTLEQAQTWRPALLTPETRHRAVRVIREYGLRDRREAPQYFPDVAARAELAWSPLQMTTRRPGDT